MQSIKLNPFASLSVGKLITSGKELEMHFLNNIKKREFFLLEYDNLFELFKNNSIYADEITLLDGLLEKCALLERQYEKILTSLYYVEELSKHSTMFQPKRIELEITKIKYEVDIQKCINNIQMEKENVSVLHQLKFYEDWLAEIQDETNENGHIYTLEYLKEISNLLRMLEPYKMKCKELQQEVENAKLNCQKIKKTYHYGGLFQHYINNHQLISWGKSLEILKNKISTIRDERIKNVDELAVGYLLYLVLSGKVSFYLFERLTRNDTSKPPSKYSFQNSYKQFTECVSKGIQFDCVSPQYLPYGDISYSVATAEMREISYRPNTNSDISPDLINGNYYAKPEGNLRAKENWIVKLSRKNTFFLTDLNRLATLRSDFYENINCSSEKSKGFFNFIEGIKSMYPQFESVIDTLNALHGTEINTQKFFDGLQKLIEEYISPIDKKKLIQKQIISKCSYLPQVALFKYIFTFAHDKDLANYITRVGGITMHRTPGAEKDILNPNGLMNRSLGAYHNPFPQEHYVILAKKVSSLYSKKNKSFFPMSDEGMTYDSNFNVYFEYINSILIENKLNDSQAWDSLFYLFLEVNGISFSYDSNRNNLYLPVYNDFLLNVSNQITRMIRELAKLPSSHYVMNEKVLFFPLLSFSPDEVAQFCTEENILKYFEKPYQKFVDGTKDEKLKSAVKEKSENESLVNKTLPQQVYKIIDHLMNNPNPVSMRMCTALLYDLLGGKNIKYKTYEKIFLGASMDIFSKITKKCSEEQKSEMVNDDRNRCKEIKEIVEEHLKEETIEKLNSYYELYQNKKQLENNKEPLTEWAYEMTRTYIRNYKEDNKL